MICLKGKKTKQHSGVAVINVHLLQKACPCSTECFWWAEQLHASEMDVEKTNMNIKTLGGNVQEGSA